MYRNVTLFRLTILVMKIIGKAHAHLAIEVSPFSRAASTVACMANTMHLFSERAFLHNEAEINEIIPGNNQKRRQKLTNQANSTVLLTLEPTHMATKNCWCDAKYCDSACDVSWSSRLQ